jgi:cellulose biosynthesis protein BcsQ
VLVLGGGDGLAVREILKYPDVQQITLVDLDEGMTVLFQQHPRLTGLNARSLTDARVTVVNADAFTWLDSSAVQFDFVVIDTPPMLGDELIMSLVASDHILIPTQAQDYSIDGLEELMDTFEIIKETENPKLEFSIIPSMVNPRRKIERQRLEELSQSFNVTPTIRNLVDMQESVALKKPVFMFTNNSKGKQDYKLLWDSLGLN